MYEALLYIHAYVCVNLLADLRLSTTLNERYFCQTNSLVANDPFKPWQCVLRSLRAMSDECARVYTDLPTKKKTRTLK